MFHHRNTDRTLINIYIHALTKKRFRRQQRQQTFMTPGLSLFFLVSEIQIAHENINFTAKLVAILVQLSTDMH